jgi:hypothetical protein
MALIRANTSGGGGVSITKLPLNGTASASQDSASAYLAFDQNTSTKWVSNQNTAGATLYYQFPSAVKANLFSIIGNTDYPYFVPPHVDIYGSLDNSNWTKISSFDIDSGDTDKHWGCGVSDTAYTYYRFDMTSRSASGYKYVQVSSIEMYYIDFSSVLT